MDNLKKYIERHKEEYQIALSEIRRGKKRSHWIWYIFPQITGLGESYMCKIYDIKNLEEAIDFLKNDYLRGHLCEISQALLKLETNNIRYVMYFPDNLKLQSSMTLFKKADEKLHNICNNIFQEVLDKFFKGEDDERTLKILEEIEENKKNNRKINNREKNEKNKIDGGKNEKFIKRYHVQSKDEKEDKKTEENDIQKDIKEGKEKEEKEKKDEKNEKEDKKENKEDKEKEKEIKEDKKINKKEEKKEKEKEKKESKKEIKAYYKKWEKK